MWNHIKLVRILKAMLPLGLKLLLIRILVAAQHGYYYLRPRKLQGLSAEKRKIFVLLSTDYANLGDHAMTYAHIQLLERNFPDYQIVEVLVSDTLKYIKHLASIMQKDDIITLKGGGNIGLEYFREELFRRLILKSFKNNKIVLFPQTVYFPDTFTGKREFAKTIAAFNAHPDFSVITRDLKSFDMMKGHLRPNKVYLTPDIVLSLGNLNLETERFGVTICLRDDKEGIHTQKHKNLIADIAHKYFDTVNITDTVKDYVIKKEERESELRKIWTFFSASRLVITDRLHGMIFAAITSTPCLVLGTYNHKLLGAYKWIEHLNYINFIKCESREIVSAIEHLGKINVQPYRVEKHQEAFDKIIELIQAS
jgi:pyruvyl transferase EpsI